MTVPRWQPGTVYLTGALVRPRIDPAPVPSAIPNAGFELGDQDWFKSGGASIVNQPGFSGNWCARVIGSPGRVSTEALFPVSPGQSVSVSCMGSMPAGSDGTSFDAVIVWYDADANFMSSTEGVELRRAQGAGWRKSTTTGVAPAGAAFFRVAADGNTATGGEILLDNFALENYAFSGPPAGLIYRAVQPDPGTSAADEPAWPPTAGQTVVDGSVIWEAVITTRVVWRAEPIMLSGATEPTWPLQVGESVLDNTILWTATSRAVTDPNCPQSKVVIIAESKVWAGDRDLVAFSAVNRPRDWSSPENAGFLPVGLQKYGADDVRVLALYRGDLMVMNNLVSQRWQIDPDPQLNERIDELQGVGSSWNKAAAAVSNDLFFLNTLGVRSVGMSVGLQNLQAGDVGMPIDDLVQPLIDDDEDPIGFFYSGAGQYWLVFPREAPPVEAQPLIGGLWAGDIGGAIRYENCGVDIGQAESVEITGYYSPPYQLPDGVAFEDFVPVCGYDYDLSGMTLIEIEPIECTPDSGTAPFGGFTGGWRYAEFSAPQYEWHLCTVVIDGGDPVIALLPNSGGF